ncbi:alpha-E domain-containing protein [Pseudooceanicola sp. C21-150M6]|uniref:alpha-E domain-containing protein n=1 Tax=Pseudooceanicola sp. C21-150M6 TaxID=3434355 RepID=UPI003D7F9CDC
MLGKTANGLFWMYRYLERAENTARLVETGQRMALTRLGPADGEWKSILETAGVLGGFEATEEEITKETAIDWMLRSKENFSSVMTSIAGARQNARMVRTALTHDVWEAMNGSYMKTRDLLARKVSERDLPNILGTIRQRAALVRGATHGTMLRNDIYNFARIGTFLERADNTARILDTKYYVLLPSVRSVGSSIDNVQWETILRSVSARGGFRMAYGNDYDPRDIAYFLILDGRMPRSLSFCVEKIRLNLGHLNQSYGTTPDSMGLAETLAARLKNHDIEAVFEEGLHEYIQDVLIKLGELGRQIEIDYRFYE